MLCEQFDIDTCSTAPENKRKKRPRNTRASRASIHEVYKHAFENARTRACFSNPVCARFEYAIYLRHAHSAHLLKTYELRANMKILFIEDDTDIACALKTGAHEKGFSAEIASDGKTGITYATKRPYDVIVVDLNLPDMHGSDVCSEIRSSGVTTPILVLTVHTDTETKVHLLNAGADDYVTKPFSMQELAARLKALTRRPSVLVSDMIRYKNIEINLTDNIVRNANSIISLTRKEYLLLEYLMRHQGKIVSRAELMESAWEHDSDLFSKSIETHILNIRRKIDAKHPRKYIKTVSGRGYMFGS